MLTCAPATAAPACETLPVRRRSRPVPTFATIETEPAETNERVSTVPAMFGAPVPGAYGVVIVFQIAEPAGEVKTPSTVKTASRSCAPKAARPGVPGGTSEGARQTTSL